MARPKKPHTRIQLRAPVELADWFRDYAERKGVSMSQLIKAYLEALQRQDGQVPQQAQREGRT